MNKCDCGFEKNDYICTAWRAQASNIHQTSKNMEEIKVKTNRQTLSVDIDRADFALSLKKWRLRNGLTQKQLGEHWGVSRETIVRAEGAKNLTWGTAYKLFARLSEALERERT